LNENFRSLTNQIEIANQNILKLAVEQIGEKSSVASAQFTALIGEQMRLLRDKVESTRESAVETTIASAQSREIVRCNNCLLIQYRADDSLCRRCRKAVVAIEDEVAILPRSAFQAQVLALLLTKNTPMRIADVALAVHRNEEMTTRAIEKLSERGLVEVSADADGNLQLQHTDESRRN
jgi:DNA-binding MarR family transcriptional regulator